MTKTKILFHRFFLAIFLAPFFFLSLPVLAEGEEELCDPTVGECEIVSSGSSTFATLDEPVTKPVLQIKDQVGNDEWQANRFETYGIRFVIRAKEALKWSLSIKESGFHNPAIEQTHAKVLTIANSLFILGLLAIAGLWMFSAFLPAKKLKRVMLAYAGAVIFVNFALPFNQLLIDGADLLQSTLMTKEDGEITVTDVVQTPDYQEGLAYKRTESQEALLNSVENTISLQPITGNEGETIPIGIIEKTQQNVIESVDGQELEEPIELSSSETQFIQLNSNQPFVITRSQAFDPHEEQSLFTFFILMATGFAYFIVALVFILRFVILWGLLILSPLLLLLAVFKATRGWFINWLGLYGRWLLIGPLMALGLSIVISIWRVSGLPVEANLVSQQTFLPDGFSNIAFYLPGRTTPNTLSNTTEMMEYIVFLVMLYLPVFFAFALTRQKTIHAIGGMVVETIRNRESISKSTFVKEEHRQTDTKEKGVKSFMQNIKQGFDNKMNRLAEVALPSNKKIDSTTLSSASKFSSVSPTSPAHPTPSLPSFNQVTASQKSAILNPQQSTASSADQTPSPLMDQWKKTLGTNGSMVPHVQMVQSLAFPQSATHEKEAQLIHKVRQEVVHYAKQGNEQAIGLLKEVKAVQKASSNNYTTNSTSNSTVQNNIDRHSFVPTEKQNQKQNIPKEQAKVNKIPKNLKTKKEDAQNQENTKSQNEQRVDNQDHASSDS